MRTKSNIDRKTESYTRWVIRWRWAIIVFSVAVMLIFAYGGSRLTFSTDYRIFFSENNPQLISFEALQNIYTKNNNILFVIEPESGNVFEPETLDAIEKLTAEAWKVPYSIRVDGITNFQHTRAFEDDLIVKDLVIDALSKSAKEIQEIKEISLSEPLLVNTLVSPSGHVAGVNVTLQLPGKSMMEVPEAVQFSRNLADEIRIAYPGVNIYLTGTAMMNNAFSESVENDLMFLTPVMFGIIFILMFFLLRSAAGTFASLLVILFSTASAMGIAGWLGYELTAPTASAPTIIMTIAIADSIHILVSFIKEMKNGLPKIDAIVETMRINMQPVFLTSLTTAIGFLSMNFSDSPPFQDLGNITAFGVTFAFLFSVIFLPAFLSIVPIRISVSKTNRSVLIDRFADWVISNKKVIFYTSTAVVLFLGAFIPSNELNDQFVEYFDESVKFRTDTDFAAENLSGINTLEFSLKSGESGGISNPEYLSKLEDFRNWFKTDDRVMQVTTFSTVMKKLNKNMHGDDPDYYRIPESRDLAAQYLLLYEMSLPYGLDLNNQINVDKSSTRFRVNLVNVTTNEIKEIADKAEYWLRENAPEPMFTTAASIAIMFAHISERNVKSMLVGTTIALVIISIMMIAALRSWKYGLISLVPNFVPAVLAFGLWGLLIGEIGLALSAVTGMTLGIVVDDTVHFMTKYVRARREKNLDSSEAVKYAFSTVGIAMAVTSVILIAGFLVLTQSSFKLNSGMGLLTSITIAFALLADFLMLPSLLLIIERKKKIVLKRAMFSDSPNAFVLAKSPSDNYLNNFKDYFRSKS